MSATMTKERYSRPARTRSAFRLLARLAMVVAMLVASLSLFASTADAARTSRVTIQLQNFDREAELDELFDALDGYDYRTVSIDERSATVVLDVSAKALKVIYTLTFLASISAEDLTAPAPAPLDPSFRVLIRAERNFYRAYQRIQKALQPVKHVILEVDEGTRTLIISMRERDVGLISTLGAVESVELIDPENGSGNGNNNGNDNSDDDNDEITPLPEGESPIVDGNDPIDEQIGNAVSRNARTQRVIVQYKGSDRRAEERRILRALDGTRYKVAKRFGVTPAIVLDVDKRAMQRLLRLKGVTVSRDAKASPSGDDLAAPN